MPSSVLAHYVLVFQSILSTLQDATVRNFPAIIEDVSVFSDLSLVHLVLYD
jgi:hypothetical protein